MAHVHFMYVLQRPQNVTAVGPADWHKLHCKQWGKRRVSASKLLPHVTRVHFVQTVTVHFTALTSSDSLFFITFSYSRSTLWGQEGAHILCVRLTASQAQIAPIRNFESRYNRPTSWYDVFFSFSWITPVMSRSPVLILVINVIITIKICRTGY
jgi:hypothetical protein